ncbi:MAG: hypothetical protein ACJ72I_13945 [Pseudonocardiaceae bacterium]
MLIVATFAEAFKGEQWLKEFLQMAGQALRPGTSVTPGPLMVLLIDEHELDVVVR